MNFIIKKTAIIICSVLLSITSFAQPENNTNSKLTPIPAELFLGTKEWSYQMVIDKKFTDSGQFGIFGLAYLRANYDNDVYLRESLNLALFKYNIYKGISVLSGALYSSHWGYRPYAGAQYLYHSRKFMFMINSGLHLTETKNFETIAMVEYHPAIKGAWSLYTRVQGMYSFNTLINEHDRSYLYGRLGLSYKTYSAGLALNYDVYGFDAMQIRNHQLGIFVSALLF